MSIVLGVDGGGTGCRLAVLDTVSGRRIELKGGPANAATDLKGTISNLKDVLERATKTWGSSLRQANAYFGLAGVYSRDIMYDIVAEFAFKRIKVTDDRPTAVVGSLGGQDGFLIMAGTGMIAARSLAGAHKFVGGYGFTLSDHGSGAWIGRALIDVSIRCHDGLARPTPVTLALMETFENDPFQAVDFARSAQPSDFAALAPMVFEAARNDDPTATRIVSEGIAHVTNALSALGFRRGAPLCLAGGIGPHYMTYMNSAYTENLILPEGSALDGALHLAGTLA